MSKDERLVGYVSSETKASVEQLAARKDQSVSEFVAEAVDEKVEKEKLGTLSEEYSVEMKLLRMIDSATDRAVDEMSDEVADRLVDELADRGLLDDDRAGGSGAVVTGSDDDDDGNDWNTN